MHLTVPAALNVMQKESAFDKVLLHVITILWVAAGISGVWLTAGLSALLWRCMAVGGKWEDRFTNVRALPLIFWRNLQDYKAAQVFVRRWWEGYTPKTGCQQCVGKVYLSFLEVMWFWWIECFFLFLSSLLFFFLSKCHNSFHCEKLICRS